LGLQKNPIHHADRDLWVLLEDCQTGHPRASCSGCPVAHSFLSIVPSMVGAVAVLNMLYDDGTSICVWANPNEKIKLANTVR